MKQKNIFMLLVSIFCISFSFFTYTDNTCETEENTTELSQQEPRIPFVYDNEDIVSIIHEIAALKPINIVLPPALAQAKPTETIRVTLHIPDTLSLDQAWDMVIMLLDSAGYATVPQGNLIKIIKKEGKN